MLKKNWVLSAAMLAAIAGVTGGLVAAGGFPAAHAAASGAASDSKTAVQAPETSDGDGETADDQTQADNKAADAQEKPGTEVADDQEKPGTEAADDQEKADAEVPDAQENAALAGKAKISQDAAVKVALGQVKGTMKDVELEDENGTVVFNVTIVDAQNQTIEAKVDAVTGKFVKAEKDGADENGQDEQDNGADGETADD